MKKELNDRMTKAFAALASEMQKNPKIQRDAENLVRDLVKDFRGVASANYTASVEARKAERAAKRDAKSTAIAEARAARDEAKAKFAAALAIKVNTKVAKKRANKPVEEMTPTEVVDAQAGGLVDLPAIF